MGSRAPYAKPRREAVMKQSLQASGDFPESGPTSMDWLHKKLVKIQRGNEGNVARDHRLAQENLLTARLDEEKLISELTTNRRASLIGEEQRLPSGQRNKYTQESKGGCSTKRFWVCVVSMISNLSDGTYSGTLTR